MPLSCAALCAPPTLWDVEPLAEAMPRNVDGLEGHVELDGRVWELTVCFSAIEGYPGEVGVCRYPEWHV